MPGDRLAFAVLVRREQELVGVLELLLQLADLGLLVGVDDVERLEVGVDRDAHRPVLGALLLGHVAGAIREVADVPDARLDVVIRAEIARDGLRLRGALDDHKLLRHGAGHVSYALGYSSYGAPAEPRLHPRGRPQLAAALRPLPAARARPRASPDGPYVLAANHNSNFDPWPLGLPLFPERYLRFMAKSELFWTPFKQFATAAGAFPGAPRRARHRGPRDGRAALPRGAHRRHVPGGHAAEEGDAEEVRGACAHRRGADRARGRGPARSGGDRRHRPARPARRSCVSRTAPRSRSTTSPAARTRRRSRPSG